jgi:hypothetical protein
MPPIEPTAPVVSPGFLLLIPLRLDRDVADLPAMAGIEPHPPGWTAARAAAFDQAAAHLLGRQFLRQGRIRRQPLGRIALSTQAAGQPGAGDVTLVTHSAGVALWEVWLPAPAQPLDAGRWIGWLDPDAAEGIVAPAWAVLSGLGSALGAEPTWPGLCFPHIVLRAPDMPLATLLETEAEALVRLLMLDRSAVALKPEIVAATLEADHCARQDGMTLLARRAALDIHARQRARAFPDADGQPAQSALPFIITVETLILERAALSRLYDRLVRAAPQSVDSLLALKRDVYGALEEYYGATLAGSRFSDSVSATGEALLGITDLYEALMERLDGLSFEITTRYQNRMTLLQFWLTIVFGATEIGFIASSIATWHYRAELGAVLAWTVGAAVVSGMALAVLLWRWTR